MRTRTNTATRVAAGVAVTMLAALGVELTHPGHTAPRVEIITPASSTTPAVDADLAELDRIPAASTTPDTVAPPATVPAPAAPAPLPAAPAPLPAATIDAAPLVVARPAQAAPTTTSTTLDPDEVVMYRWPDGFCGQTTRGSAPAGTVEDPSCSTKPTGSTYYVTETGGCAGMSQQEAASRGYPDGDPACSPQHTP